MLYTTQYFGCYHHPEGSEYCSFDVICDMSVSCFLPFGSPKNWWLIVHHHFTLLKNESLIWRNNEITCFFDHHKKKHEQWQDTPYFYPFLTEKNPQQKQSSDSRILEDWAKWYDRETSAVRLPSSDLLLREGSAVLQDAWCYSLPWRMAIEIRGVSNKMGI